MPGMVSLRRYGTLHALGKGFALLVTCAHLRHVVRFAGLACVTVGAGPFAGVL